VRAAARRVVLCELTRQYPNRCIGLVLILASLLLWENRTSVLLLTKYAYSLPHLQPREAGGKVCPMMVPFRGGRITTADPERQRDAADVCSLPSPRAPSMNLEPGPRMPTGPDTPAGE